MISIPSFFRGKNLLIVGGTGFLAKALTEKILRSLPEIARIYLLIRPRSIAARQISAEERLRSEVCENSIFNRLRRELGADFENLWAEKIAGISGDLSQPRLGLDEGAYVELTKKIDLVCNCAATVTFDERLDTALELNVLGPRRVLEFAQAAAASYIHISTAYVSGRREGLIPDELLAPTEAIGAQWAEGAVMPETFSVENEIARLQQRVAELRQRFFAPEAAQRLRFELVEAGMRRAHSLGWNDTYAFTKFLGELCVRQDHGSLPTLIVRPSIIESSLHEPEPGWIDGLRMCDPIIIGLGKGRVKDFPVHRELVLDMIPVDLTVNAILCGAATLTEPAEEIRLLTIASGAENPLNGRDLIGLCAEHFSEHPLLNRRGRPIKPWRWEFLSHRESRHRLERRYLPLVRSSSHLLSKLGLVPGATALRRRLQKLQLRLEQVLYYIKIYGPYTNLRCRFDISKAKQLMARLTPEDRVRFPFDPTVIDWRHYVCEAHIPGLKRHILHLPDAGTSGVRAPRRHLRAPAAVPVANSGSPACRSLRWMTQKLTSLLMSGYWRLQCQGLETIPADGPRIFAANHCSHLDLIAIRQALGPVAEDLYVMGAKDYFFDTPLKSWFFSTCFNVLPMGRQEHAAEGLAACRSVLESGRSILLFPEGTRSLTGNLQPFKAGIGVLAVELEAPVIPLYIRGTFGALPKGAKFPRPGRIEVRIAPPVDFREIKNVRTQQTAKDLYRQAASLVHERIAALAG